MGVQSQKLPDNRLWAILFIAVSILVPSLLRQVNSENIDRGGRPELMLHDNGRELEWLPGEAVKDLSSPMPLRAELTPFFFAPVPVNSADKNLLTTLPGIGPGMAERIIDFRTTNGPIRSAEGFMRIPGIGSKRYASLQPYISF